MRIHSKKGADLGQISQIPLVRYASARLPTHVTSFSSPPSLHGDCHSIHRRSMSPADGDVAIDVANTPDTQALGSCAEASLSTASMHNNSGQRRHGLSQIHILNPFARIAHRLTRSKRQRAAEAEEYKSQLAGPVPDFTPRDPEDCMCAICLCDYEDGEILRLLPCHHHMHQGCVDEWLHINQKCPLCKQSVVGGSPKTQDTASSETSAAPDYSGTAVASGESETPAIPATPAAVH
ncbi:hypothetical protein IWW56_004177 [Coemansia sp. RSA 2131]|nr:hypothetical protein IWW56_004177 [Coemansia sp. RSA 2131]